jgi:arabinofuranan 3-O-arabinosyltransferase
MNVRIEPLGTAARPGGGWPDLRCVASCARKLLEIEDRLFTEWRLCFYGSGVVAAYALGVLLWWRLYPGYWVVAPDAHLANIDFCWIWVSGKFAALSDPFRIYDHAVYAAAQDIFYRPGECLYLHQYVYPPTFLFLTYPLGLMPYLTAFAVWVVATLLLYLTTIHAIISRPAAIIVALTSPAVLKNIQLGHTGFVVAALIGLSLVLLERRPWVAGIFLGLLTCKPQYGVLFPLALLASRNWRALASATVASVAFGVAGGVAFGFHGWPSFLDSLIDRNAGLNPDEQVELVLQSTFGLLHWIGASAWISWAVHATIAALVAVAVCAIWAKPAPVSLKAAALCIGAVMFTPYVLAYDLCLLSIAVAFLVSDGLSRGFLPGERVIMLLCWAGLFFPAIPIAPIICAALLFLVVRRIVAGLGLDRAPVAGRGDFFEMKPVAVD